MKEPKSFEYMKAATVEVGKYSKLRFPVWASPKLDGFRASVHGGKMLTSSLMQFPNIYVNQMFNSKAINGLDGELIAGEPFGEGVYARTSSAVTRELGQPDVTFWVFDYITVMGRPFEERLIAAASIVKTCNSKMLRLVEQIKLHSTVQLETYLDKMMDLGYEGTVLRTADGSDHYKYGRSTMREQYLMKLKPFEDSECIVIGIEEKLTNTNEEGNRGRRRSLKAGMVPAGTLGKMWVRDLTSKAEFFIGLGKMTHAEGAEIWKAKGKGTVGRTAKYKFQRVGMVTDLPRQPIFLGWREKFDLAKEK